MSSVNREYRLLPTILDHIGTTTPRRTYAAIPRSQDITQGFRDVTTQEILHAVDALAHWLVDEYGRSDTFETITYVGVNDLRYVLIFYASIKAGYKVSLLNSRHSIRIYSLRLLPSTLTTSD